MKKQLLAVSMVAASGLLAQNDSPMPNQTYQQTACDRCCCNPCCCTNPRPCVDCECYVPPFYNLQCDWGFSFDAEFLYWYGRETNLSYATTVTALPVVDEQATNNLLMFGGNTYQHFDTSWDPGFRIGIGFNSSSDGWDYNLVWTWYRNTRSESTSVSDFNLQADLGEDAPFVPGPNQAALLNPWVNAGIHYLTYNVDNTFDQTYVNCFDTIKANYRLRFNQIDLDFGRKYWLSKCFNMRPFTGFRGAWTRVNFSTTSSRTTLNTDANFDISENLQDTFKTRAWGIGIIAGVEPTLYYGQCFALYSKAGTGVIWGDFEVKKDENYTGSITTDSISTAPNFNQTSLSKHAQMTGLLDVALGIRWEATWCCDRFRSTVDLGWEHHILFDQNHRYKSYDFAEVNSVSSTPVSRLEGYRSYDEATGNLGLGGFVLRVNFDF